MTSDNRIAWVIPIRANCQILFDQNQIKMDVGCNPYDRLKQLSNPINTIKTLN